MQDIKIFKHCLLSVHMVLILQCKSSSSSSSKQNIMTKRDSEAVN